MSDYSMTPFLPPHDATGPVTCAVCGCRLMALSGANDGAYRHFPSLLGSQDARGCRPHCVDALHDHEGRVIVPGSYAGGSAQDAAAA
jgi:hypothetical protein